MGGEGLRTTSEGRRVLTGLLSSHISLTKISRRRFRSHFLRLFKDRLHPSSLNAFPSILPPRPHSPPPACAPPSRPNHRSPSPSPRTAPRQKRRGVFESLRTGRGGRGGAAEFGETVGGGDVAEGGGGRGSEGGGGGDFHLRVEERRKRLVAASSTEMIEVRRDKS